MTVQLAIFASGNGTNTENIIRYFASHPTIAVAAVFCNKSEAVVLQRAEKYNIPTVVFSKEDLNENGRVLEILTNYRVDWIVLAGFLWKFPESVLHHFPDRVLNIHPALLPQFGGKGMYGMHIHRAVVAAGVSETGITIHRVNQNYDEGAIVFQQAVAVLPEDSPETVAQKIAELEQRYFPVVIEKTILENLTTDR